MIVQYDTYETWCEIFEIETKEKEYDALALLKQSGIETSETYLRWMYTNLENVLKQFVSEDDDDNNENRTIITKKSGRGARRKHMH